MEPGKGSTLVDTSLDIKYQTRMEITDSDSLFLDTNNYGREPLLKGKAQYS